MKKIIYIVLASIIFSLNILQCKAICNDDVLLKAKNINVEAIPITENDIYYIIRISNLTPELYVTVYEDDNKTTTTYTYEDSENGVIDIEQWYIYERVYYTVNVYSECDEESLNELYVNTKKFNKRFRYEICVENPELEKCQPFYEEPIGEEQTDEEFYNEVQQEKAKSEITTLDKIWNFIKDYYLYVIIPFAIIGLGYGIAIYIYKSKRGETKWKKSTFSFTFF